MTCLMLAAPLPGCGADPGEQVNVILISLDSLRADHVGCYGYDKDATPNLDRLAARWGSIRERRGGEFVDLAGPRQHVHGCPEFRPRRDG